MVIQSLDLRHFRNYTHLQTEFSPETNWIFGKNGQGKTNLVEAIYYICNLESFRTRKNHHLLQSGHPHVDGRFEGGGDSSVCGRIPGYRCSRWLQPDWFCPDRFFQRSSLFLEKIPFEGGYNFESALNPGIGLPFSALNGNPIPGFKALSKLYPPSNGIFSRNKLDLWKKRSGQNQSG